MLCSAQSPAPGRFARNHSTKCATDFRSNPPRGATSQYENGHRIDGPNGLTNRPAAISSTTKHVRPSATPCPATAAVIVMFV